MIVFHGFSHHLRRVNSNFLFALIHYINVSHPHELPMIFHETSGFFQEFSRISPTFFPNKKIINLISIDWFKGTITGKSHDLHWKIDGFRWRFSHEKSSAHPITIIAMLQVLLQIAEVMVIGSTYIVVSAGAWLWLSLGGCKRWPEAFTWRLWVMPKAGSPPVNVYITINNHHVQWVIPSQFSIGMLNCEGVWQMI